MKFAIVTIRLVLPEDTAELKLVTQPATHGFLVLQRNFAATASLMVGKFAMAGLAVAPVAASSDRKAARQTVPDGAGASPRGYAAIILSTVMKFAMATARPVW